MNKQVTLSDKDLILIDEALEVQIDLGHSALKSLDPVLDTIDIQDIKSQIETWEEMRARLKKV